MLRFDWRNNLAIMRVDDIWRFNVCSSLESSEISCIILYNHIHINIYIYTYILHHITHKKRRTTRFGNRIQYIYCFTTLM